ncbi:sugar MFS transporter [Rhodoblastus acidophilus]|uniref:Sugar MFS transporter n=1 Tax=Candidatus Rhodoblastus alkanivorans TaxID=2954117 RepID=A0ABS9Z5L5_9HYPH|nr:sugar MFS transporter [Candidatus Rhodoblastus alkanivorans]MCI4679204.1 sugar MFS transporter [Candidatus Rhodoblastus alkanivorans]MCI4682472.1 sugar MFS transporter [Candidatus Rhodoblastus alkanivorans]MDI4639778.1 sugar MFS transporter [Rhodoblastus acidophilus]
MSSNVANDGGSAANEVTAADAPELRLFVMALFFIFGGVTSLNDVIIPKLKELFSLDHMQAMLVQSAFFAAYFTISLPAAALVRRLGFMRGAVVGLLTMMLGCLLFVPVAASPAFSLFLAALFVLASGITIVQVVANPLISLLGPPETAHSRLTFAQGFNSLGTTVFPYFGAILILGSLAGVTAAQLSGPAFDAYRAAESRAVAHAYVGLAAALTLIAGAVWLHRNRLKGESHGDGPVFSGFGLLKQARFAFGTAAIFLYVGAEVAIGSLIVLYLEQKHVLALDDQAAGKLIPLYWGGALIGRFIGSGALRLISPGRLLAFNALGAVALILLSANETGALAGYSLLAIGLMNSIMFPTIFSLASEGLGARAAEGSGIICVAIVGGAVIPPLTGRLADVTGSLSVALALPALCYAVIAFFGLYARRPVALAA